ncbi:MAG: methylated-DNA--[protein]-cysteine S-methyltransferase [Planctomycetes bacterium]|nr:methylated-DNA--[protein]-cysteine S-methyltransferase [Planctomycetota bacterium]
METLRFRKDASNASIRFGTAACSLGFILAAASEKGICAIALGDDRETLVQELRLMFPSVELIDADAKSDGFAAKAALLAEHPETAMDLLLDIRGTEFQLRVWKELLAVQAGTTATYSEVAERIGAPRAVRAVASACAANKLALAIPCHRVIRSDGGMGGYRWGIKRKTALLDRERAGSQKL